MVPSNSKLCLLPAHSGFFVSKDLQLRKGVSTEMGQGASQVVLVVRNPSANARDAGLIHPWVGKITWRRKMAMQTSILAWKIHRQEEPSRLLSMSLKESGMTEQRSIEIGITNWAAGTSRAPFTEWVQERCLLGFLEPL